MSRIARKPVRIPTGVTVQRSGDTLLIKGKKGEHNLVIHNDIAVNIESASVSMSLKNKNSVKDKAILGTTIVLLRNMITGVNVGFEKKLQLIGVGYRAKAQGNKLELSLGYSHPVEYIAQVGISVEAPSNTDVIIKGIDKEKVGQTAAEIRNLRPPEAYKGKGVRYATEVIILKETKKK